MESPKATQFLLKADLGTEPAVTADPVLLVSSAFQFLVCSELPAEFYPLLTAPLKYLLSKALQ